MPESARKKIQALLDRVAPQPRSGSREDRRRARAIVAAALIGCVILAATAVSSLTLGLDPRLVRLNFVLAIVVMGLVIVARQMRSPALLANSVVGIGFAHTLLLSALAGGRNTGALFAFSVFPMLAVLLVGWRSGLVFTALSASAVVLTPLVPLTTLAPSHLPADPPSPALIRDALNVILAIGLVAVLYDAVRSSTLRDAEESRSRAEDAVGRQQQLIELSRKLHDATGSHFDSVLSDAMEQSTRLAGANRSLLQLISVGGPGGPAGRFTWGVEPPGGGLARGEPSPSPKAFRWAAEQIRQGRIIQARQLADLPEAAERERAFLTSRGVTSWLCVPIRAAGEMIGFQSFETVEHEKEWDDEEVAALQLMTELLGSTVLRHRTEQALRESEEKFALAFRDHPDAMVIMDLETDEILECNEQWLREAGDRARGDVLGKSPWDFQFDFPEDQREAMRQLLRGEGRLPSVEVPIVGRGGERRTYLISASRIELGGRACVLANIHDLTERQHLEQQLLHAQKMEAIGRLAGGVAHDYNNMLTVISGYSAGLIASLDGDLRRDAEEIHEAARRSAALTRQLLAFSRRQVLQTEVLDPNSLVSALENMLRPLIGESIHLTVELADEPGLVSSDRGQLEQAVVNLVVNGRDAMPDGGSLTLTTQRIDFSQARPPSTRPRDLDPGSYVVISVSDEGEGMDPELAEHVMEPFYTTKPVGQGTGLGLPMVHGLARQCGGTLDIQSEPGRGTRMSIYLPVVEEGLDSEAGALTAAATEGVPTERILLAEDETNVRRFAARTLRAAGYDVVEVSDGEEARARAAQLGESFDLVVSDVVMPRLSGEALVQSLRAQRAELPVVLMSGYPDLEGESEGEGRPIPDDVVFLQKPFGPDMLLGAVARALRAKRESAG